mgnify:CR=1 FL=1
MTDIPASAAHPALGFHTSEAAQARLRKRYRAEGRFKIYGIVAILIGLAVLATLLVSIVSQGYTAFVQTTLTLDVYVDPEQVNEENPGAADYQGLVNDAIYALFPEDTTRDQRRDLRGMVSIGSGLILRDMVTADPSLIGQTVSVTAPIASNIDQLHKGNLDRDGRIPVSEAQLGYYDTLLADGAVDTRFNWSLFTNADSREPELAGLRGALLGSLYLMFVTFILAFPIGIGAAIYLEEFAPKNRWTDLIEVNINNLAAVPSIVFGLLGLAVFISVFGLPRSAPLVGGMVLSLMTLPTIIIATRASLKAVPPSIREAALGVGASRMQAMFHHTLPLAMPGILTGTIIGLAQALGETAPLLMIGMNAFVTQAPDSLTSASSALPVQVYMWSDSSQRGFVERTSAAIMVLLGFLILMNAIAVLLRRRFERRW